MTSTDAAFACPDDPPVEIGPGSTRLTADPAALATVFRAQHAIVCPGLLAAPLLARLTERCDAGRFVPDEVEGLGTRESESPQVVGGALNVLLARAPLYRWLEAVTGCDPIGAVSGRVVQTRPNGTDQLRWHDDLDEPERLLAVTIDLGSVPYTGGVFELRRVGEPDGVRRFRHARAGTGLIFALSPALQHRVTRLEGGGPRRLYTGWFLRAGTRG